MKKPRERTSQPPRTDSLTARGKDKLTTSVSMLPEDVELLNWLKKHDPFVDGPTDALRYGMRARKKEIEDVNAKHSINDVVSAALDQKFKNLASSHIVMKELLETIQGQHRGPRAGELENDVDALKRSIEFNVYTWAATIKLMELYRWIGTPVVLDKYPPELLIYQIQLNEYHASNKSKPAPSVSELYVRDWKTIASNAVTMYSKTKYAPIRGLMESVHEVISDVLISTQGHSGRQKLYAHIFWMPFTLTSHILGLQPAPGLPAPSTLVCNMQILAQRTDTTPPDCATA